MVTCMLTAESDADEDFVVQPFRFEPRKHVIEGTSSDTSNGDSDDDVVDKYTEMAMSM